MSNIPITSLPITNPLTGEEAVPIVQAGTTKRTTTGAISALPFGQGSTFASGISFITVTTATVVLPSSRVLAAASPITLTDAGTSNTLTIGLGITPGTGTVTSVGLSGGTTGLTISNSPITTSGTMTISGTLGVPNGGTGTTTLTAHGLVIGQGTSPVAVTTAGSAGQVPIGQGAAADPVFRTLVGDISMTAGGTANASNAVGHALLNLAGAQGLVAITSSTTATQRAIVGTGGITVTFGDGASGNPTISLTTVPVRTVQKQAFTVNGTYTPTTGMLYALAEGVGGGGGGGGVAGTGSAIFIAGGGGSGAYAKRLLTAAQIGTSQAVTIGAGGNGGATGPNNAAAGAATSLGSLLVAAGGAGGAASSVAAVGIGGAGGLAASSTGDIVAAGNPGAAGFFNTVNTAVLLLTGMGGCSFFGGGARAAGNAASTPGIAGGNYGGGGSGGLVNSSIVSTNGGTGSAGVLYITEWCSQ